MSERSVRIKAADAVTADTTLWRTRGKLSLTVAVKVSFAMVNDAEMEVVPPIALFTTELNHKNNPARTIRATPDLVPFLQRADVLVTGHAFAPRGKLAERVDVRLRITRDRALLDKTLHVYGTWASGAWEPFESVPLVYERAIGGPGWDDNPFGVGASGGVVTEPQSAQIFDPSAPLRTAGLGPISSRWPARKRLLGKQDRRALEQPLKEIVDDFDWSYFQAAPRDQQIAYLEGDEWITLEGFHPDVPRINTRLPSMRAAATIRGLGPDPQLERPLHLWADILRIDADDQVCSLVFRCVVPVHDEAQLAAVEIKAGLAHLGQRVAWPEDVEPAAAEPSAAEAPPESVDPGDLASTLVIAEEDEGSAPSLPFEEPAEAAPPEAPPAPEAPPIAAEPRKWERTLDVSDSNVAETALPFLAGAPASARARKPRAPLPGAPWSPGSPPRIAPLSPFNDNERTVDLLESHAPPAPQKPPPARTTDAIRFVLDGPFVAFAFPFQIKPGRDALIVVVKATCAIGPEGPLVPLPEPDLPSGDVHAGDDPMHTLLYPDDFAVFKPRADVLLVGHAYARGPSAVATRVSFRFGRRPSSFDRELAIFGARKWQSLAVRLLPSEPVPFQKMPLVYERAFGGPGVDANPIGLGSAGDLLPQIEDPEHLVRAPGDSPAPAGFAGIPALWPERAGKTGTYDAAWHKERWPYLPADFDWRYYQAAPPAQQLDFLEGDEPFEIVGMHPEHGVLRGSLPRIRPRCFAQKTKAAGGTFHEVVVRLDTVTFDVDAMKANLVWRGILEVRDDEASEVAEMFVMAEGTKGPRRDIESARAVYEAVRAGPAPVAAEPPPPLPAIQTPTFASPAFAPPLAALTPTPALPLAVSPPGPAAAVSPREAIAGSGSLEGLDFTRADLNDADLSGRSLARAVLKGALLRGAKLAGADLSEAVLAGADLTDADLTGADLTRADLTGATLEGASLEKALLTGALFSSARAARAKLVEARGEGAQFGRAILTSARFDRAQLARADFTAARLDEAVFDEAKVPSIRLYDATGARASFKQADMTGARADESRLERATFSGIIAPSSVWDRSVLSGSTFQGALLEGSGFVKATCDKCVFASADLTESRFTRADLTGASFVRANLMKAQLGSATLTSADLRGANLHGAETLRAKLDKARLDDAIVTQTKLAARDRP